MVALNKRKNYKKKRERRDLPFSFFSRTAASNFAVALQKMTEMRDGLMKEGLEIEALAWKLPVGALDERILADLSCRLDAVSM